MKCSIAMAFAAGLLGLLMSLAGHAETRLGIFVGVNNGYRNDEPLKYAVNDARKMKDTFVALGQLKQSDAILLSNAHRDEILSTIRDLQQRVSALRRRGERAVLIFYFNGHGDRATLHLGGDGFDRNELSFALTSVNADLVISIIDACQTDTEPRRKGVRTQPLFDISAEQLDTHEGMVTIQSTMAGRPAYESDELQSALFTHHFVSALRGAGDVNLDKRISLLEAYNYAYLKTVHDSAESSEVIQQPHFDMTLKGAGDFVLTDLHRANATVTIESNADARYLFFSKPQGQPIAEIYVGKKERVSLAFARGEMLVHKRTANGAYAADVFVPWHGTVYITPSQFRRIHFEEHTLKGGAILHPHQLLGGYLFAGEHFIANWRTVQGASMAYQYLQQKISLSLLSDLLFSSFETSERTSNEVTVGLFAMVGLNVNLKRSVLLFSAGPGVHFFWQQSTLKNADRYQNAGIVLNGSHTNQVIAPGGKITGEWQWLFHRHLGFYVRGGFCTIYYSHIKSESGDPMVRWLLESGVGLFVRF